MRSFSLAVTLVSVPLLLLLWLLVVHELATSGSVYRDWFAPLGLALLMTAVILSLLRLAHRRDTNHSRGH
jgi:hypothetical protein